MRALVSILASAAAFQPPPEASAPLLYGLALVVNGLVKVALASLDPSTGAAVVVGGAHSELFGMSDLVATAHGALYYLGDTSSGATLVALNLTDGSELCSAPVALREIKFVGIGQTLNYDASTDTLVLSGLAASGNASHAVYRAPARGCGPFRHVGTYGDAAYVPMLHAAALDASGQRLFVTLGTSPTDAAIGVIDLRAGGRLRAIAEGPPSSDSTLLSLHYDPRHARLFGPAAVGASLQMHALDPSGNGTWEAPTPIANVPKLWNTLGGNGATASAFDPSSRRLYLTAGRTDPQSGNTAYHLATIDVDAVSVVAHPPLAAVGMPGCTDCLEAIAV